MRRTKKQSGTKIPHRILRERGTRLDGYLRGKDAENMRELEVRRPDSPRVRLVAQAVEWLLERVRAEDNMLVALDAAADESEAAT